MGLWYSKDTGMSLTTYADADHVGCQDTRCSTSRSAQFLGDKLVSWSSKKQKSTAISSTKAEYITLSRWWLRCDGGGNDDEMMMKEMRWMSWWCGCRGDGVDVAVVVMTME
ncbi:hypothetical protein Tco_1575078 [Tanacetum coccineum]